VVVEHVVGDLLDDSVLPPGPLNVWVLPPESSRTAGSVSGGTLPVQAICPFDTSGCEWKPDAVIGRMDWPSKA